MSVPLKSVDQLSSEEIAKRLKLAQKSARWRAAHPEKARASVKKWFAKNPDYHQKYGKKNQAKILARNRQRKLKKMFGLTPEDYQAMCDSQQGLCAICKQPPDGGRMLDVDHSHETGRVRGLLCRHCNLGLGNARDNIVTLRAMIDYLTKEEK